MGLIMYSNENNETFPTGATAMTALNKLYPDYVSERKAFKCPSDNLLQMLKMLISLQAMPLRRMNVVTAMIARIPRRCDCGRPSYK